MRTLFGPVRLYTQPQCRSCDRVKQKLEDAGVEYRTIDISDDGDAYAFVRDVLGAKSVPVLVSDTHDPIFGYDPDKLKALITWYTEKPKLAPCQLYDTDIHDYVYEGEE